MGNVKKGEALRIRELELKHEAEQRAHDRWHEKAMKFMDILKEDSEMKYFIGALTGMSVVAIAETLKQMGIVTSLQTKGPDGRTIGYWTSETTSCIAGEEVDNTPHPPGFPDTFTCPIEGKYEKWVWNEGEPPDPIEDVWNIIGIMAPGIALTYVLTKQVASVADWWGNIFELMGMGFAGICIAILLIKAVTGDDGLQTFDIF